MSPSAAPAVLEPGMRLAHFEVVGPLGSGAMSEVYEGRDVNLNLPVAIKVIAADVVANDANALIRFEQEARSAARLNHANICRVYYYGIEAERPFLAMELVQGISLDQVIEQRLRLSWNQMLDISVQAARGLRHAALAAIVHRDIKPANLMLGRDGIVRIVDFGLSTLLGTNPHLSDRGLVVGTPNYVAPEAIRREPVDWRSDQYSFGVSLYHLLVGRLPFAGDDATLVMRMHLESEVPDLVQMGPDWPPHLARMVMRMMSKDPGDRYPHYEAILEELDGQREALEPRLEQEIAWCPSCGRNTCVEGTDCPVCSSPRALESAPEYCHVEVAGFDNEGARSKVAAYLARSIGRAPGVVENLLEQIPFKLAHRMERSKAELMKDRLVQIGAQVELKALVDVNLPRPGESLAFVPMSVGLVPAMASQVLAPPRPSIRWPWVLGALSLGLGLGFFLGWLLWA